MGILLTSRKAASPTYSTALMPPAPDRLRGLAGKRLTRSVATALSLIAAGTGNPRLFALRRGQCSAQEGAP
jgi:hypothetical protein